MHLAIGACVFLLIACLGVLLLVVTGYQGCSSEGFVGKKVKTRSFKGVVGLRAKLTTSAPVPVRYAVVFHVDSKNKLLAFPIIPYENQPLANALIRFKAMFGARNVETLAMTKTHAAIKQDKVVLEYDPKTRRVTQVLIPKRWSVSPDYLDITLGTLVRLNPTQGAAVAGPYVDIRTDAKTGLITSAVLSS